jgi:transcriptional regulator with XRE-family HTH domain
MNRQLFGEIVHRARMARGLTLEALGAKARISKGYLSGIENGKVNPPSSAAVLRMAQYLALPEELSLLAFVVKAPKAVRGFPAFVEFAEKVTAACREKKMI